MRKQTTNQRSDDRAQWQNLRDTKRDVCFSAPDPMQWQNTDVTFVSLLITPRNKYAPQVVKVLSSAPVMEKAAEALQASAEETEFPSGDAVSRPRPGQAVTPLNWVSGNQLEYRLSE